MRGVSVYFESSRALSGASMFLRKALKIAAEGSHSPLVGSADWVASCVVVCVPSLCCAEGSPNEVAGTKKIPARIRSLPG